MIVISEMSNPIFLVISLVVSFLASLAVVQISVTAFSKIVLWAKTPNPKNISVTCLPLSNNEIRFKVSNLEFRKKHVIVSKVLVGLSSEQRWISSIESVSTLKFLKSAEFPFIKLHLQDSLFEVVYPDSEAPQMFGVGVHKFDIAVNYGYATPREGLLSRYEVVVEFSGGLLKIVSLKATTA